MMFEWKRIQKRVDTKVITATDRAKVSEGWLVRTTMVVDGMPAISTTFLPDPAYLWEVDEE